MELPSGGFEQSRHMRPDLLAAGIGRAAVDWGDFTGGVSVLSVGEATLIEIQAAACRGWTAGEEVARGPSDALCIHQYLEAGGAEFAVSSGSLAGSYFDLPSASEPAIPGSFHLRLVKIPMARCNAMLGREHVLIARSLTVRPGPTALFARYFESFVEQAPHLTGDGAEAAVQTLAQLAVAACGMADLDDGRSRNAVHSRFLRNTMQMIEGNIHRSDLSPALMAGLLGISVRQLHLLFEPTGFTYGRYVLSRRLERARLLLAQAPKRPVADVAYACGFDSLSTFYRSFRAVTGLSPADFRDSLK